MKRKNRLNQIKIMGKCINVGYLNCRSTKQRPPVLEGMMYDFDIMHLQETLTQSFPMSRIPVLFPTRKLQRAGGIET